MTFCLPILLAFTDTHYFKLLLHGVKSNSWNAQWGNFSVTAEWNMESISMAPAYKNILKYDEVKGDVLRCLKIVVSTIK